MTLGKPLPPLGLTCSFYRMEGLWSLNTIMWHGNTIQPHQGPSPQFEFEPNSKLLCDPRQVTASHWALDSSPLRHQSCLTLGVAEKFNTITCFAKITHHEPLMLLS